MAAQCAALYLLEGWCSDLDAHRHILSSCCNCSPKMPTQLSADWCKLHAAQAYALVAPAMAGCPAFSPLHFSFTIAPKSASALDQIANHFSRMSCVVLGSVIQPMTFVVKRSFLDDHDESQQKGVPRRCLWKRHQLSAGLEPGAH